MKGTGLAYKKIHKKVWGKELWLVNTDLYCCKILSLKKGYKCSYHMHPVKDETFYVLEGIIILKHDNSWHPMRKNDSFRIKPGHYHSFKGVTDAKILEVSTHHSDDDVMRKTKSKKL